NARALTRDYETLPENHEAMGVCRHDSVDAAAINEQPPNEEAENCLNNIYKQFLMHPGCIYATWGVPIRSFHQISVKITISSHHLLHRVYEIETALGQVELNLVHVQTWSFS
ncbi:MAG: hypothetical protein HC866_26645, partial [Leptolyngbyaceae cyanobacterium RU_5_1]|nr:hypothetical protein [Leptolyngbyaceae cyanobacterium RU_5_1]